ncbi:gamma-glutamyl-gamma-aminobutyrate hydrolase family protein [Paenibacillus polysaccharolyticus]|uniref:glutamine amidotransferase-related protein n=1 Tax=Paenibacillus polysaccharolyticus TaxID=582692 RepID=UPI00209D7050|nr:gamma-glutamyl-gamma-aminobutyrate hydrolase family protein [Paenibacillus polysaccharolyticus]MCP1136189.1 gamma-glutamyl-gamma-aminobutyrate hydrolase family protein [Paenibacillus polysaccharolyticus]
MNIHFIIHEAFEAPGTFMSWVKAHEYNVSCTSVYLGEKVPDAVEKIDFLIVLGGPQSPDTTIEECPHFDAAAEIEIIRKCIDAKKVVLGVCLGAQLIGEALGAKYEHSPETEIGCHPITFTEEGRNNDLFSHFGETSVVGHWHNDMPGLTSDSRIIAYSEGCPRQIIRYQKFVYGFQCHLEFNPLLIELLIENSKEELTRGLNKRFVQQPESLRENNYKKMEEQLNIFLTKLVREYNSR